MFDGLTEQIASHREAELTRGERITRYLLTALVSVVLFGGLLLGVWFLEY